MDTKKHLSKKTQQHIIQIKRLIQHLLQNKSHTIQAKAIQHRRNQILTGNL